MTKNYLYIAISIVCLCHPLQAQKFYFNGLGRTLISNSRILGNALDNDTTSARKKTSGYILFDFGINYQPSDNFRASSTIRLRNEVGGFYGTTNKLSLRQMKIEGVVAKAIKIEAGGLDLGLTPYTLYNFDEIYHDYEAEVFAIRRRITNYENFNFGNNWRLEGFHASSDLQFSKGFDRIGVKAFLTNTGHRDYFHLPKLQNIISGARVDLVQSKFFRIGGNYLGFSDIRNQPEQNNFSNVVLSADYKISVYIGPVTLALYGEAGKSNFKNQTFGQKYTRDGKFYEGGISTNIKPWTLNFYGSYRMVDEDFSSPGAQTRRIFDNGIPQLFSLTDNNNILRTPSLLDRYSEESIRNISVRSTLLAYLPQYNNITPYGIATPNRKGLSFGFNKGSVDHALMADGRVDLIEEVKPDELMDVRKFTGIKGGILLNIHKLLKREKLLSVNFGIRKEDTKRDFDSLRLKSTLWDAGINVEIFKNFDLLFGYKLLKANGHESYQSFSNLRDGVIASGLRYRFSRNTFFTAQGHWAKHLDRNISDDYRINQLFLNFTMIF
jgi:hypothetical protein